MCGGMGGQPGGQSYQQPYQPYGGGQQSYGKVGYQPQSDQGNQYDPSARFSAFQNASGGFQGPQSFSSPLGPQQYGNKMGFQSQAPRWGNQQMPWNPGMQNAGYNNAGTVGNPSAGQADPNAQIVGPKPMDMGSMVPNLNMFSPGYQGASQMGYNPDGSPNGVGTTQPIPSGYLGGSPVSPFAPNTPPPANNGSQAPVGSTNNMQIQPPNDATLSNGYPPGTFAYNAAANATHPGNYAPGTFAYNQQHPTPQPDPYSHEDPLARQQWWAQYGTK